MTSLASARPTWSSRTTRATCQSARLKLAAVRVRQLVVQHRVRQHFNAGSDIGETDFEGLAIHCSEADSAPGGKCSTANGGAPDVLPDEPGGYTGFNALFGAVNVNPVLTGQLDRPLAPNYTPGRNTPPPAGNWQAPPVYDVFAPNATDTGGRAVTVRNLDASTLPAPPTSTPRA